MTEELHGKVLEPTPEPTLSDLIHIALDKLSRKEKRTPAIQAFRRAMERYERRTKEAGSTVRSGD